MGLFTSSSVEKESNKAAQILNGFVRIAIFSAIRGGMWVAGSGGSGIVVARLPDGTWSPPSAFSVRSGGVGIVWGVDMYDCVCILNTESAIEAYSKPEMNLGGGVALAAGPAGWNGAQGGLKPVWTYTRSRGLYGGLTVDGTVIKERQDANAEFFGKKVSAAQVLKGDVQVRAGPNFWPAGAMQLIEVLKLAEGKAGDEKVLGEISTELMPGDLED